MKKNIIFNGAFSNVFLNLDTQKVVKDQPKTPKQTKPEKKEIAQSDGETENKVES